MSKYGPKVARNTVYNTEEEDREGEGGEAEEGEGVEEDGNDKNPKVSASRSAEELQRNQA